MKFWIDAQLPPAMATWLPEVCEGVEAATLDEIGLRRGADTRIFDALRTQGQVVVTKDSDFLDIIARLGPPPQIVWVTCGNVTNRFLKKLVQAGFARVLELLEAGEPVIELAAS